jgi:glycerol-1-phosphate dehydrogenase [NAD(P)+]
MEAFSHGFKVAVGSLISSAFMSELFGEKGVLRAFIEQNGFSPHEDLLRYRLGIADLLEAEGPLKAKIVDTIAAKTPSELELHSRAERARQVWPELAKKVVRQIPAFPDLKKAFSDASCPTEPGQIGLSRSDCIKSLKIASLIRRRYTVLDLASELGALDAAADIVFSSKYFTDFAQE